MITTTKDNTKCIFAHGGMSISTNGYTKPCCQIKKGEGEDQTIYKGDCDLKEEL